MRKLLFLKELIIQFKKSLGHNQIVVICFGFYKFLNAQELDTISFHMKRHVVENIFAISSDQDGFIWLAT
ncbi:MAG: hypothetical protein P8M34_10365 [Saprospiraceae bacterium]|nr:hypothetical protein [Saprospiraceae bacterium]